jgi:hypothetical protein
MLIKTKVLQGHTITIDKTVNEWAKKNNVMVKNVTLSPFGTGSYGKAGYVTATVVYEVTDDHPIAIREAMEKQRALEQQQAWAAMPTSSKNAIVFGIFLCFAVVVFFFYKIVTG